MLGRVIAHGKIGKSAMPNTEPLAMRLREASLRVAVLWLSRKTRWYVMFGESTNSQSNGRKAYLRG